MRTQPTNVRIASAWERMVANVNTTMRIVRGQGRSPETSELLDGSSSHDETPPDPNGDGGHNKPDSGGLERSEKARALRDYVFDRSSALHNHNSPITSRPSMTGPLLLSLVFIAASTVFFALSTVWRHQDPLLGGGFLALACLCGVVGAVVAILAVVGILGDK